MPRQAPTLYDPFAVLQPRRWRTVFANSLRLSLGKSATVLDVGGPAPVHAAVREGGRPVVRLSMGRPCICLTPSGESAAACQVVFGEKVADAEKPRPVNGLRDERI